MAAPAEVRAPRDLWRGRLRVAVLLWAAGLVLLMAFVVALVAGGDGDGEPRPVPLQNVQVGEETDEAIIQAASTPVVAANPTNPANFVMGYRIERPNFSCAVATSFDEGRGWAPSVLTLPPGTERCYTTSLGFARDGTLHLAFVSLAGVNNVPSAAWITRSTDGGRTFEPATKVLDREKFMVRLAVDPDSTPARLFLTWVEPQGIGLFQMAPPSSVMAMASGDGGRTFGSPMRVSSTQRDRVGAPVPVVGRGGALHVVYYDYRNDVFDFQNVPGRYEGTFELLAATSTDGGATFSEATVDAGVRPPEPFLVFTPPFPAAAADRRNGRLYAAWSDARAGRPAVLLAASADGGRSWSSPRRLDDGPGEALLPQLAVADGGRLDAAFVTVMDGAGRPSEVRLTSSDDQGRTFGPAQALNRPFFRELFPLSPRREAGRDLGSALALASRDSLAYVAWPDTRRGGTDTLRVDIVGAPVRLNTDGGARRLSEVGGR